jgi:hypothetical protein
MKHRRKSGKVENLLSRLSPMNTDAAFAQGELKLGLVDAGNACGLQRWIRAGVTPASKTRLIATAISLGL